MSRNGYRSYQVDEVPESARHHLEKAKKKFGFVPNLLRFMAESPAALHGYLTLDDIFASTSLSLKERTVVILTASVENGCRYCIAAHSTQGLTQGISHEIIHAIRTGGALPDPRFGALRNMVRDLIRKHGCVSEPDVRAFLDAGFTREQLLETVVGIAVKTISNYTNHIVDTPLDSVFVAQKVEEAS